MRLLLFITLCISLWINAYAFTSPSNFKYFAINQHISSKQNTINSRLYSDAIKKTSIPTYIGNIFAKIPLPAVWTKYSKSLNLKPIRTKSVSAALGFTLGELLYQGLFLKVLVNSTMNYNILLNLAWLSILMCVG